MNLPCRLCRCTLQQVLVQLRLPLLHGVRNLLLQALQALLRNRLHRLRQGLVLEGLLQLLDLLLQRRKAGGSAEGGFSKADIAHRSTKLEQKQKAQGTAREKAKVRELT